MAYKKSTPKAAEGPEDLMVDYEPGIQVREQGESRFGFGPNLTGALGEAKGNRGPWGPQKAPAGGIPFKRVKKG